MHTCVRGNKVEALCPVTEMTQLVNLFLIPPAVGLATYFVVRRFWNRDEVRIIMRTRRRKLLRSGAGGKQRPGKMRGLVTQLREWSLPSLTSRDRVTILLMVGAISGFLLVWYY
jgi:hypothetical protein